MDFPGEFETHVTAAADPDALRVWADRHRLKFVHILLDAGRSPSQPMLTRHGRGTLADERARADELVRRLTADGFTVSRVKIEAAPTNRDVPVSDADAVHHPGRYFEHHVKLRLAPDADLHTLARLAEGHAARLSRNARRVRADGFAERFVTQRCHGVGRDTATAALNTLLVALRTAGHEILETEAEFVLVDSFPGLDAGWLDAEDRP